MPTCPNGHQSGSDDWCEVCGHRMAGSGGPVPPPSPPPAAPQYGYPQPGQGAGQQGEPCPQCGTPREANAPFCEHCRWNFLTNTATSYVPPAPRPPGGFPGRPAQEYQSSRPSQMNRPAESFSPDPREQGQPGRPGQQGHPGPQQQPGQGVPQFQTGAGAPQAPAAPGFPDPYQREQQQPYPQSPQGGQQGPPQGGRQQGPPQGGRPGGYGGDDDWLVAPPSAQYPPSAPAGPATWTATIGPDRNYFMAMMQRSGPEAAGLNMPAYSPEQQLPLTGSQVTIGRRRHSTGDTPNIDLSVPPEDPGVSHQHAVLALQQDGSWAVVDQNSTNGTTVNGGEEPIQPFVTIPLSDGDQVHVGAWTTITIHRD